MKLNLEHIILQPDGKPFIYLSKDLEGKEENKQMTIRNSIVFVLLNIPSKLQETDYLKLHIINKKIIQSQKFLDLRIDDVSFLKKLILESQIISDLIKATLLGMLNNNGKF